MFSSRLKSARQYRNMTLEQLADKYNFIHMRGLNKGTLSKYENNKQEPMITVVSNLAEVLDVSVDFLLGKTDDISSNIEQKLATNLYKPEFKKVPLLGSIACGEPILAEQNVEDYVSCELSSNADFALKCKGDSMINANIYDGDLVFIKQQPIVENGQIAAVLIGTEATLKRVYINDSSVTLLAENPNFPPLTYSKEDMNDVQIIGKAVAHLKYL